jgi:hypothetical protein
VEQIIKILELTLPIALTYGMLYQRLKNVEGKINTMSDVNERLARIETKIDLITTK